MHNLLLGELHDIFTLVWEDADRLNTLPGVVKTQWYGQWILDKTLRETTEAGRTRELHVLHTFNADVSIRMLHL